MSRARKACGTGLVPQEMSRLCRDGGDPFRDHRHPPGERRDPFAAGEPGTGMGAGPQQIEVADLLAAVMGAEPGALPEHGLQAESSPLVGPQAIAKIQGCGHQGGDQARLQPGKQTRLQIGRDGGPVGFRLSLPVGAAVEVWHRGQGIEGIATAGGQGGVRGRRAVEIEAEVPGQHLAVEDVRQEDGIASTVPAGSHPDDAAVLKERGVPGLRKHKLLRFANEAYDQGGLLIQEDLALLLTTSIRTIQRDMQEMRKQGIVVPTRGEIQDIGPTVSHKTQIIELYLKGYEYTEIEQRTRHTGDSIKRYISGFSKVVLLSNKGYSVIQIRELTNSSEKVVSEYLALYMIYKEIASDRLNQIGSTSIEKLDSKKGGLGVRQ